MHPAPQACMEDADLQDYYDGDEAFYGQKWDIWSFFAGLIYIYIPSKFTKMAYFSQVVFFSSKLVEALPKAFPVSLDPAKWQGKFAWE
jgi:hypothetical protein